MTELFQSNITLGSIVTSKKTGLPAIGKVVGIMYADYFNTILPYNRQRWDELFPDWREKLVLYILFNSPQKPCSEEEYFSFPHNEGLSREESNVMYKWNVPIAFSAHYPIDDLELVEE